jgi:RNA polymerase sigma-70 factor (ECF subfamily)
MVEQSGHGRLQEAEKSKMRIAETLVNEITPSGKAFPAGCDRITSEQYAAAFAAGNTRTSCFLLSRGCSPALAEELSQAAWTRGWEHRAQLRDRSKVLPWVNSIALNLLRSEFRRREVAELTPDVPVKPQTGPREIDLKRMLEKCSPTDRALLRKHYLAGFTSSEIAQHLNCSAVTVRVRLLRLRRRMQTEMTARPIGAAPVCA